MASNASPRADIAKRLSRMIQLPTVSAELESRGNTPFEAFVTLLEELYPLVHTHLTRERITDFGLLFHWRGSAHNTDPAVLMAHYDVVPVDESDPWSYPPFEGHIADGFVYGRGALDDKGPMVVLLDAVVRLLPGVMGNDASGGEESFENGLLEHPHYTRPPEWEGRAIPDVLMSGNHGKIAEWRVNMKVTFLLKD